MKNNKRLFPKIRYTNFKKAFPISKDAFNRWFTFERFWNGNIIEVCIKWHCFSFDFRKSWLEDMIPKGATR